MLADTFARNDLGSGTDAMQLCDEIGLDGVGDDRVAGGVDALEMRGDRQVVEGGDGVRQPLQCEVADGL